jgi:phosphoribosylglycinamide formyltransferase-1
VKVAGCTVHIVGPHVDEGPIIAQAAVPVEPGDDVESLHDRIHEAEHVLYPRAIALAIAGSDR